MAPPTVTDPTQLPGAILFLTVTMSGTPATIRTLIAYDPEIVPNKPLADSIARWKVDHFPYRERFTTGKVANFGPNDYYSEQNSKPPSMTGQHRSSKSYKSQDLLIYLLTFS